MAIDESMIIAAVMLTKSMPVTTAADSFAISSENSPTDSIAMPLKTACLPLKFVNK